MRPYIFDDGENATYQNENQLILLGTLKITSQLIYQFEMHSLAQHSNRMEQWQTISRIYFKYIVLHNTVKLLPSEMEFTRLNDRPTD